MFIIVGKRYLPPAADITYATGHVVAIRISYFRLVAPVPVISIVVLI